MRATWRRPCFDDTSVSCRMVSATAISFLDGADLNEGENPNPLTSTVERRALSLQALDLAHIRPHGHGAADGVDVVVADQ